MSATPERLAGGHAFSHPDPYPQVSTLEREPVKGSWGDSEAADEPWRVLTAAQVQSLRAADPGLSPWRVVWMQALVGAVCTALAGALTRQPAVVWSAWYGAAACVLPSALMARGMTRGTHSAVASAAGFMFWEMLKVGVAIAMLVIAVRVVPHLSWPALLVTMVVCIKVNWLALLWRGPRRNNKV